MKRVGGWLFRHRSYTPIPLYVVMACVFWKEHEMDSLIWPVGLFLVVSGETLRLWAIRHIGRSARTRKAKAERLVTTGPYALARNPLYLANMMIGLGACVLSELLWIIPAFVVLFAFQYSCIIVWEQDLLRQRFGRAYDEYVSSVPLFVPRLHNLKAALSIPPFSVREAFRRERDTLFGHAIMLVIFLSKELVDGILIRPHG